MWPLAQAFATSFELERPAFERSYPAQLARADSLVLVATTPDLHVAGYLLASEHATFLANGPHTERAGPRSDRDVRGEPGVPVPARAVE